MFRRTLIALACAAPAFLSPLPASGDWRPVGPFGSEVTVLAVDPATSNVLAGTRRDGLFRSKDRGVSWQPVFGEELGVGHIVFDPQHPGTVYASADSRLLRSTNGGKTWSSIGDTLPIGDYAGVEALAIDPRRSVLYVGLRDGLFKTADGGRHWTRVHDSLLSQDLAVDPVSSALYAATPRGLYRSRNGGAAWQQLGLDALDLETVSIAPSDPSVLYAGGRDGLYRSTDGGAHWLPIHQGLPSPTDTSYMVVTAVAVHPSRPSTLYVTLAAYGIGTTGGLFRSVDGGAHWTRMGQGLLASDRFSVVVDPRAPSRVYTGSLTDGVFRSVDAGRRWSWANAGLRTLDVTQVMLDSERPGTVYAGSARALYKSTDAGRSWRIIRNPEPTLWITGIAMDPQQTSTIYVSMPGRLERSDDSGAHWQRADLGLRDSSFNGLIAIDPSEPSTLYGGGAPGVFKSTDRGGTWAPVERLNECTTVAYDLDVSPAEPSVVFASALSSDSVCSLGLRGLFKSVDGGAHWALVADFMTQVVLDPADPAVVYGLDYFYHLNKSTDGGARFVRGEEQFTALVIDPADPSRLYAGGIGAGAIFTSADAGATWEQLGGGIDGWVFDLAVDAAVPGRLWAGTSRGIFVFDP